MAPTFRSSRSGRQFIDAGANRNRTGQVDHDVFEGLPVRRWIRQPYTFSQAPKADESESTTLGANGSQPLPELPMPKDSHLLTPMSRALLRAARAGCKYIRHVSKDSEEEERETAETEEPAMTSTERSFTTRKWTVVPRHLEPPEVEFLAKRRPGLPSLYGAMALSTTTLDGARDNAPPPMRKTKFKKVDTATGNVSVYEAWVPKGHSLEGEIVESATVGTEQSETTVTDETPAPGTVVEGIGVVNADGVVAGADSSAVTTPPKKQPPPPKRKAKGTGKGRKKKVMFAPGEGADATVVHGTEDVSTGLLGDGAVKDEAADTLRMSIDSSAGEQLEGEEDDEEDDEEGEGSDEGDESTHEAKSPATAIQEAGTTVRAESNAEPQLSNSELHPVAVPGQFSHEQTLQASTVSSGAMSSQHDLPLDSTQHTSSAGSQSVMSTTALVQKAPANPSKDPVSEDFDRLSSAQPPAGKPVVDVLNSDQLLQNSQASNPVSDAIENLGPVAADEKQQTVKATDSNALVEDTTLVSDQTTMIEADTFKHFSAGSELAQPVVTFDDGEIDLLGSLEASLGNERGKNSAGQDGSGSLAGKENVLSTSPASASVEATQAESSECMISTSHIPSDDGSSEGQNKQQQD
ncbi:hypothetical protein VTN00DRAFT_7350 [Thermoascus crustaceus]|uniref:uncharacterized protein n=1 Tax=Thermoascus crustaceus TaxID=5088 RepID=UPI0037426C43